MVETILFSIIVLAIAAPGLIIVLLSPAETATSRERTKRPTAGLANGTVERPGF
jgi:hypothetical protein